MKKATLMVAALVCAYTLTAGIASAQKPKYFVKSAPSSQTMWAQQSPTPPYPTVRTPVAGYSPNLAAPQPATKATLETSANRLIRWEGWLDVDAFSISILNQMQKQLGKGIEVGSYTLSEPAVAAAVAKAKACDPTFEMNENLRVGVNFESTPTLYVWTYRHNFADKGTYQLYVSAKGKMDIGTSWYDQEERIPHKDIQSLNYEFSGDGSSISSVERPVFADIEIWRGAVVEVDRTGVMTIAGNLGGVVPNYPNYTPSAVVEAPMSDWEHAPSLICNPNYNPKAATGAAFVEPLERAISIRENSVQKEAGDVQQRVRTITPFRYR